MRMNILSRGGLFLFVCVSLVGCTGIHGDLCQRAAECGGGGDPEIDACLVDLDSQEEVALIYDCGDRWDAYAECLDAEATCDGDKLKGCKDHEDAVKACIDAGERGKAEVKS